MLEKMTNMMSLSIAKDQFVTHTDHPSKTNAVVQDKLRLKSVQTKGICCKEDNFSDFNFVSRHTKPLSRNVSSVRGASVSDRIYPLSEGDTNKHLLKADSPDSLSIPLVELATAEAQISSVLDYTRDFADSFRIIWAAPSQKVPPEMRKMDRFRFIPCVRKVSSAHLFQLIHSIVSNSSFCGQ